VALVSDARVRALNRTYRGVDYATDVLSFPAADVGAPPGDQDGARRVVPAALVPGFGAGARRGAPFLGDIVIAAGVAARQAAAAGHARGTEFRVLALHGLLHLIGHDHEQGQGEMAALEARLRVRGGLRTGLIERAGTSRSPRKGRRS
jgi:probable rRNA maturation factor